jgi:hypothetical protein
MVSGEFLCVQAIGEVGRWLAWKVAHTRPALGKIPMDKKIGEVGTDDGTDADVGVRRRGLGRPGNLLVIFRHFVRGAGGHLATSRTTLQTDRSIPILVCTS